MASSSEVDPDEVSINMEPMKIPCHIYHRAEASHNGLFGIESMKFIRPQAFCMKVILYSVVFLSLILSSLFFGFSLYHKYGDKSSIINYRAVCAVPYYANDIKHTPCFLSQVNNMELGLGAYNAPQIFEELMDDFPYGYVFRENIEFNITSNADVQVAVNVTDFKDSFYNRFLHDVQKNNTIIIDFNTKRCYIMPLVRNISMTTGEFLESMKGEENFYTAVKSGVTRVVKRVVLPTLIDLSNIEERVAYECRDKDIYMLDEFVPEDFRGMIRMVGDDGRFIEFFGKRIIEYIIVNVDDIPAYEMK